MKLKTFKKYLMILAAAVSLAPIFTFADTRVIVNPVILCDEQVINSDGNIETPPCLTAPDTAEGKTSDFTDLLHWLLSFMLYAAGILAVLMLVIGGVQYVLAGSMGNPEKISDAQSRLLSALGGLVLALGAWIILYTINPKLLNIDLNLQSIPNTTIPGGGNTTVPGGNTTVQGNSSGNEEYIWQQGQCASGYSQGGDKCFGSIGNPPDTNYVCCKKNK